MDATSTNQDRWSGQGLRIAAWDAPITPTLFDRGGMLETGIDLIEVERVEQAIAKYGERFLNRVYTEQELAYCRGRPHELAARFAAKEAMSKLLGVGIQHPDGVRWREIEVVSGKRGKPSVNLTGRAEQRARKIGFKKLSLSLSHSRDHAIALVIAQ